jgi:hypothetical protein
MTMSSHPPPTRTPNLRQTRLPGATDNTRYGEGAASPHSFLKISTAIQAADAQTILNAASSRVLGSRLTSVNAYVLCVFMNERSHSSRRDKPISPCSIL